MCVIKTSKINYLKGNKEGTEKDSNSHGSTTKGNTSQYFTYVIMINPP